MQSQQFCYWLQGSFELNDTCEFSPQETQVIKEHLDMVFQYDHHPNGFCQFLRGYMTISKPDMLDKQTTTLIRKELQKIFKNEIDFSYPPEEMAQLNFIHNSPEKPTGNSCESFC